MILLRHGQSEFNVVYSATRKDPGIRDPKLTEEGRRQAEETGRALADQGIRRIWASPYTRALETARIIADCLSAPIAAIDPLVGERAAFACDVGTHTAELMQRWPGLSLDHLEHQWWPTLEETEAALMQRCARFRDRAIAEELRHEVLVVTHWGFIRGLTGQEVKNATWLRYDPHTMRLREASQAAG